MTLSEWTGLAIAAGLVTWGLHWAARRAMAVWWLYFVFRPKIRDWLDEIFGPEDRLR